MDELWDVKCTAGHLGLSMRTVDQLARDGRILSLRVGGRWRFRPADIDGWLASQARGPGARVPAGSALPVADADELVQFLSGFTDPVERRLAFVGRLTSACENRGWLPPVSVGWAHAVEVYSAGGYATVDIDW